MTPEHPTAVTGPLLHLTQARTFLRRYTDRSEHLTHALTDIEHALDVIDGEPRLVIVWADCLSDIAGQPGSGLGADGPRGGDHSDPTSRGATSLDRGAQDRHNLQLICRRLRLRCSILDQDWSAHTVNHIRQDADLLHRIVVKRTPRPALERDRRTAADGEPGCETHAQAGRWLPIQHRWRQGILAQQIDLCGSCYSYAKTRGAPPSTEAVQHFDEHGRWPKTHIDPRQHRRSA